MLVTRYLAKDLFNGKTVFRDRWRQRVSISEVAKNFAALGANVAICGRTQEKLNAAAAELSALGAKVCAVAADVREIRGPGEGLCEKCGGTGSHGRARVRSCR